VLEKGAKGLENINLEKAVEMMKEACSIYEAEDKLRGGCDTFSRTISLLVRNRKYYIN
jgi:hypothetical protein